jgi:hypothetical protein
MQPTAIATRPGYQYRPPRRSTSVPHGRGHGVAVDPLAPARGIMHGVILAAALWAGIIAALARFLG